MLQCASEDLHSRSSRCSDSSRHDSSTDPKRAKNRLTKKRPLDLGVEKEGGLNLATCRPVDDANPEVDLGGKHQHGAKSFRVHLRGDEAPERSLLVAPLWIFS